MAVTTNLVDTSGCVGQHYQISQLTTEDNDHLPHLATETLPPIQGCYQG